MLQEQVCLLVLCQKRIVFVANFCDPCVWLAPVVFLYIVLGIVVPKSVSEVNFHLPCGCRASLAFVWLPRFV